MTKTKLEVMFVGPGAPIVGSIEPDRIVFLGTKDEDNALDLQKGSSMAFCIGALRRWGFDPVLKLEEGDHHHIVLRGREVKKDILPVVDALRAGGIGVTEHDTYLETQQGAYV